MLRQTCTAAGMSFVLRFASTIELRASVTYCTKTDSKFKSAWSAEVVFRKDELQI